MVIITSRQKEILKIIVEEYIKTVHPVGSKSICDSLDVSSATVRSEMAELEAMGYLEKEHISSGRIPSEVGYRYYVDNLMQPKDMTGEDMLKLQQIFHNKSLQITDAIGKSLEIISEMTNYTSVVLGPSASISRLERVEILPIEQNKIVAIVITDKGHVEHKNIVIEENISLNEIKQVTEIINKMLYGTLIDEVSQRLEYDIKPIIGEKIKQQEEIFNVFYNVFNDFANKSNMYFVGKNKFLKQPEFDSVDKIRKIMDKFEDKDIVESIKEDSNGINIYIGHENNIDDDVTVIKTKYNVNGEEGTIALIGPKRMEYDRAVAMLDYIIQNINED